MQKRAFELMKLWCDTLLTFEVRSNSPYTDGALLCPACHVVHGRIADLAFPLTLLYVRTGEKRYLETADRLIDWTEFNLSRPDGSWRNDAGNEWKAISAFSALAIGESLLHFGADLPQNTYDKWMALFVRLSDFIYYNIIKINPVINYYAGSACEQAMAWKLTGDERYLDFARELEEVCHRHFDSDGLFFGEGSPVDYVTDKGCRYIDMGYDIEESLPLLIRYSTLTCEHKEFYRSRYKDHLEFMLPDGAIDNSWGSRHNKWTWWGSRTSDGAIEGLAYLLEDELCSEVCQRVLSLYESCTYEGTLSLPMAAAAGEPTCIHHSFCHAKALAALVLAEPQEHKRIPLPAETDYGIKFFQNGCLALISHKGWRATVSACDAQYLLNSENGGGSLTLLLHGATPVCAATMAEYTPSEPLNMQYLRRSDQTPSMTPRLMIGGKSNLTDKAVKLIQTSDLTLRAEGDDWAISYSFGDSVEITVESVKPARFVLPVICSGVVTVAENLVQIGEISVSSYKLHCDPEDRGFNQVGGFIWQPISVEVKGSAHITISHNGK